MSLDDGETKTIEVTSNGNEPLKVTIVWTGPPKFSPSDPVLTNDLDIKVTNNGNIFNPWVLDPINPSGVATTGDNTIDNVEQVFISNPTNDQIYTITVTHDGSLNGSQDFSMIVTGIGVPAGGVQISQVDKDNSLFGDFGFWVSNPSNYWNYWPSGHILQRSSKMTLKAHQDFVPNTIQKFNVWKNSNGNRTYRNWDEISTDSNTDQLIAQFKEAHNTTIQTALEGFTSVSGGDISFKDPWKKDDNSDTLKGIRNRGSNAIMLPYSSPLNVNTSNSDFMGVLLDQEPFLGTYYSAETQTQQIIDGKNATFVNWSADGADVTSPNSLSTAEVFRESGAVVKANYKGVQLANNYLAYSNSSQRKIVRTPNGTLHSVYESMGKVWYENSTDNGNSWDIGNNGQPLNNGDNAEAPSIDFLADVILVTYGESYEIKVESLSLENGTYVHKDTQVIEDFYISEDNLQPTISIDWNTSTTGRFIIIYKASNMLRCRVGGIDTQTGNLYTLSNIYNVPNTNSSSNNITV